jgi:hypothetical protein
LRTCWKGETHFPAWKARILLLLKENGLKEYVELVVPSPNDPHELAAHKKEVKAKRVLLDSMKDHLIPHIPKNMTTKYMYDALVGFVNIMVALGGMNLYYDL